MKVSLRLVSAAAVAALLAACSGGGTSAPTQQSLTPNVLQAQPPAASRTDAFSVVENGVALPGTHMFPSVENTGLIAMARRAQSSNNLNWYGGPVQHHAQIYIVFWGSSDPYNEKGRLSSFVSGLSGSQWESTVDQYYDGSGNITNDTANAGSWTDTTDSVPSRPSQSAVAAEAVRAAKHFGNYSIAADYFIAIEKGHDPSGFRTQWCAFHSTTSANGNTIAYTDFPYTTDAGASCGENSVNGGSAGLLDGVTIVGGHEIEEAVTDPEAGNGWLDSSGAEIGDKCAWVSLQNTSFSTGSFPTQPLWNNSISGCSQ